MDERDEAIEQGELMSVMMATEGWKELQRIGEAQVRLREGIVLLPSHEWPEGSPSLEFLKGALYGIRLIISTPARIVQQATELRHEKQDEDAEEDK